MQYRINRLDFYLPQEKRKKDEHKKRNPLKVQMKLRGKGWLEKPQHEAMYTVCGCIVQYMKFLIFKTACRFVLHITGKIGIVDLAVVPKCPTRAVVSFQHMYTANSISQRQYVHLFVRKIIASKYSSIILHTGINICCFTSFFNLFCLTFYQRKVLPMCLKFCGRLEI